MKKAAVAGLVTLASVLAVTLTACGSSSSSSSSNGSSSSSTSAKKLSFPVATKNDKATVDGGTLTVGMITDTPFKGIFNEELSEDANDSTIMQFADEPLFKTNNTYKIVDGGAADLKLDQKAKTATITINPKVKWSDGQPLTADDIVYAYKIIANPATKSSRYTDSLANIVGLAEYNAGKSNEISGIQTPDGGTGKTVVLHFKTMKPGMTQSGNGYFWEAAAPYHYLKDVPFKSLMASDKIRKNPVFYGPYQLSKLVAGQSAVWTPNKYYYGAKPKLSKITISTVSPSTAPSAVKSKKYDIMDVSNSWYKNVKNTSGVTFLGKIPLSYSYIGFKVGKFIKGKNVENPKAKMNNAKLRQAIAYAMNLDQVNDKFTGGLSFRIPTLIPAQFGDFFDKSAKGFPNDMDKAKKLLDEAGYKMGKDGYRTDPDGKKLTIHFAAMSGNTNQEAIVKNYIQQWKKVGLRVELTNGRLMEMNSFYDKVQNDSSDIDMFQAAWSLSSEPSPNDLFSAGAPFNFSRMNTPEQSKLLADIDSAASFNHAHRVAAFKKWQEYMNKEAYVVPLNNSWSLQAVSSRVKDYGLQPTEAGGSPAAWANVSVTSK
jgi:peptide/nickel transport system substrate-binding protein